MSDKSRDKKAVQEELEQILTKDMRSEHKEQYEIIKREFMGGFLAGHKGNKNENVVTMLSTAHRLIKNVDPHKLHSSEAAKAGAQKEARYLGQGLGQLLRAAEALGKPNKGLSEDQRLSDDQTGQATRLITMIAKDLERVDHLKSHRFITKRAKRILSHKDMNTSHVGVLKHMISTFRAM